MTLETHPLSIAASVALYRLLTDDGRPPMTERERAMIEVARDTLWRAIHDAQTQELLRRWEEDASVASE